MNPAPIHEAAQELGVSVATLRRWMREGCPVASRGRRGRGCRAMIDPDAVRDWRQAGEREAVLVGLASALPGVLAQAAADAFAQASQTCVTGGERRRVAAALVAGWYQGTAFTLEHLNKLHPAIDPDPRTVPEPIERLRKIAQA